MKNKILLITFLAFATTVNFSCKKDDDSNSSIIGAWEQTSHSIKGTVTRTVEGQAPVVENIDVTNTPEEGEYSRFTFNTDNTATEVSKYSDQEEEDVNNYTYMLDSDKLTVYSASGQAIGLFSLSISGSTMSLSFTDNHSYIDEDEEDEPTVDVDVTHVITFKRIK